MYKNPSKMSTKNTRLNNFDVSETLEKSN